MKQKCKVSTFSMIAITAAFIITFGGATCLAKAVDRNDSAFWCQTWQLTFNTDLVKAERAAQIATEIVSRGEEFKFSTQIYSNPADGYYFFSYERIKDFRDEAKAQRYLDFVSGLEKTYPQTRDDMSFDCNLTYARPHPRISGS